MTYFHLEGFIILGSSGRNRTFKKPDFHLVKTSYLVLFNRRVSWELNQKVMAWVNLRSHIEGLKNYVIMQIVKGSSTVRIGSKGEKKPPEIVFSYGKQDRQIAKFLED